MAVSALDRQSIAPPATSFVGRDDDLARLQALVERSDVRLVTLLGTGGVGKTRLALQLLQVFELDGDVDACPVLLATAQTDDDVAAAIARALGVPFVDQSVAPRVIADAIGQRPMLLLLDNVEQLVDHLDLVPGLLATCRALTIVATSRIPLRYSAEHVFPVEPLATRSHGALPAPAVELFINRAQAVRPDLDLSPSGLGAIEEICGRLDGLPLAIELAAARTRFLPPSGLLERLPSRLQVLEGGPRDAPERHRTLRATIAWSYDLLGAEEKIVFRRLAVFTNGGPLEAVAAVCDPHARLETPVEQIVEALVDHSLVRIHLSAAGQPRFRMLTTIREFALEQLDRNEECQSTRLAHAQWFAAAVLNEPASTWRTGTAEQREWVVTFLPDATNLSAALETLVASNRADLAVGMGGTLMTYWMETGQIREAGHWRTVLEPHASTASLDHQAIFQRMRAIMSLHYKQFPEAIVAAQEAIALNTTLGDQRMSANNQHLLGQILWAAGRPAEAEAATRAAMEAMIVSGDPLGGALYAAQLADGMMQQGNLDEAERLLLEAEPVVLEFRPGALTLLHGSLGVLYLIRGELDRSSDYLARSIEHHAAPHFRTPLLLACRLENVGYLATQRGLHCEALELLGIATAILERHGGLVDQIWLDDREVILAGAATTLTEDEIATELQRGAALLPNLQAALDLAQAVLAIRGGDETTHTTLANSSPVTMDDPLTPRELDVLKLLASGRSNPAIAETLFISPRTVTTHLSRLYAKLGVNSRTEAVAEGMRLGLVSHQLERTT